MTISHFKGYNYFFLVTLPNVKVGTQDEKYFDDTNDTLSEPVDDTLDDTLSDTLK